MSVSPALILIFKWCLTVAILIYLSLVLALYLLQHSILYPASAIAPPPSEFGIHDALEKTIAAPDGETLAAWFKPASAGRPTILFFHGNGGNLTHRYKRWQRYAARGYGALFVDYRGYGKSSGTPNEVGLKRDALAAYDWLREQGVASDRIVVAGESLGTGLAVYTASQRDVAGVSLMSGYSSIADVAASRYWFVPVRLLIKDSLDIVPYAEKLKAPAFQQHGARDTSIAISVGEKLFAAISSPKEFKRIKNLGHNDFGEPEFEREFAFIEKLFGP
jgi:uncharacterized protein